MGYFFGWFTHCFTTLSTYEYSGSVTTIKRHMTAICMLLSQLMEKDILAINPASEVQILKFCWTESKTLVSSMEKPQKVLESIGTTS